MSEEEGLPPEPEAVEAAPPPPGGDGGGGAPAEEGAPTWIVTFADMMSLLLTFFILMFSMSEIKREQFLIAAQSLSEALGSTSEIAPENPIGLAPDPINPDLDFANPGLTSGATMNVVDGEGDADDYLDVFADAYAEMVIEELEQLVSEAGLPEGSVEIVEEEEGVYLRIRDAALFATARATLQPGGRELILLLSGVTKELDVPTIVSGHADSRPITTTVFPSNWELSAARAATVARVLVFGGQNPETVRVQSFGQYQPVADNDTPEGRARNRRVELFFSRDHMKTAGLRLELGVGVDSVETGAPAVGGGA